MHSSKLSSPIGRAELSHQLAQECWTQCLLLGHEGVQVQFLETSLRWRFTGTNLLVAQHLWGPWGAGRGRRRSVPVMSLHSLSWSHWLSWSWMALQSCQQLEWGDYCAFTPLLWSLLGYRLSVEKRRDLGPNDSWALGTPQRGSRLSWELLVANIPASEGWGPQAWVQGRGKAGPCSSVHYREYSSKNADCRG